MQIKKFVATGLTAIMAGATLAGGALASGLQDYPGIVGNNGQLDAYVVVGANAAPSDVVGAIDVAANLASLSYTTVQTSTTSSGVSSNGIEKDGITIGLTASPSSGNLATGPNAFPSITALKNAQYGGLWTGSQTYSYLGNTTTVNAHEEVDLSQGSGVQMRHDLATNNINGTLKMQVGTAGAVIARYKFDTSVFIGGSTASPQYTTPLKITFLGKSFTIVGVDSSGIKMLAGQVGTTVRDGSTETKGVTYGNYTVYVTSAANADWSSFEIRDASGKVVDTITNARNGDTKTSSVTGLDVKVTGTPRVTGTDPTTQHMEVDLSVGPTGQAEVTYASTPDTGSSSKVGFPGAPGWYITVSGLSSATAGTIPSGASVNAEYRPSTTQYITAGNGVTLPNNYGMLQFKGYNTQNFGTVTIGPISSVTAYNSTSNSLQASTLYGVQISADGNSVGSGALASPNWYPAMYLLFNQTFTGGTGTFLPVIVGYKNSKGNIQINDSLTNTSIVAAGQTVANTIGPGPAISAGNATMTELGFDFLNVSVQTTQNSVTIPFKLNYNGVGDSTATWWLNLTVDASKSGTAGLPFINGTLASVNLGSSTTYASGTSGSLNFTFNNKTTFVKDANNLNNDLLKLGITAQSAETNDVGVYTEGGFNNAGNVVQEVVGDSGVLLEPTSTYGAADQVVVKIPSRVLGSDVFFGSTGAAPTTTTGGNTVNVVAPVVNAVAKLDTEITATEKAHNLVLVGGPAVNSLTAQLMGVPAGTTGTASGIPQNAALIRIVRNAFTTGKVAVIVAGWEAADTRLATSVLQKAATSLAGQTADSVTVSGSVASPVITAQTTTSGNATKSQGK